MKIKVHPKIERSALLFFHKNETRVSKKMPAGHKQTSAAVLIIFRQQRAHSLSTVE